MHKRIRTLIWRSTNGERDLLGTNLARRIARLQHDLNHPLPPGGNSVLAENGMADNLLENNAVNLETNYTNITPYMEVEMIFTIY